MRDRFLLALAGQNGPTSNKAPPRPPIWLMRQAGRYMASYRALRAQHSFLEIVKTPELATKATLLPLQQFDFDAAIIFSDILVLLEPFGVEVSFIEGPKITHGEAMLEARIVVDVATQLKPIYDAISLTKSKITVPLLGFAGAPFTLINYALDHQHIERALNTKKLLYHDREKFLQIYSKVEEAVIEHLKLQLAAGCDAVQLFDTWVGTLSSVDFETIIVPSIRRIATSLSKPLIYFGKGISQHVKMVAGTGVQGLACDWTRSLIDVRRDVGRNIALQGNLDPALLLSSKNAIREAVLRIKNEMRNDPGFIFNLGHGVLPETPEENVRYLVEQVRTL